MLATGVRGAIEPENISYPLALVAGRITPPSRFFVRDHFAPPGIALEDWKLRIEGHVEKPHELTFSDLLEGPGRQLEAVIECAGNVAGGSAVSNGVWEGLPVRELLETAKPASDAAFVLLEGADSGRLFENQPSLPYARLVPIGKCLQPESLVAFKLNAQTLPARNGFPHVRSSRAVTEWIASSGCTALSCWTLKEHRQHTGRAAWTASIPAWSAMVVPHGGRH